MARQTSNSSRLHLYDVNAGEAGGSGGGPTGGSGDYAGVGALLKRERLRQGHDIAQVADQLRIRRLYLEALEEGRYAELPAPAYVMGFLRSYGAFLGLDVPELLRRYKAEGQHVPQTNTLDFPTPAEEGQMPRFTVIVVAVVLAVIAYGGWRYFGETPNQIADTVAEVPAYLLQSGGEGRDAAQVGAGTTAGQTATTADDRAAAEVTDRQTDEAETADAASSAAAPVTSSPAAPSSTTPAPTTSAPTTSAPTTSAPAAQAPAPTATAQAPSAPAPSASAPAAQAPAAQAPAAQAPAAQAPAVPAASTPAPAAPTSGSGIRIVATADSWLQIRAPGGGTVFSRILRAGETYDLPPEAVGASMITGNAGGIEIQVDGRTLPPLGAAGVVKRNIVLDRQALQAAAG
ncbi:helix-turn-helix domain-containing protein [Tistrella mobilis]|uniref:helix-turn-helix domain-containing protein n=1 Tax=Tistrella mobilis TaxID=171437 RepID=UPI0035590610